MGNFNSGRKIKMSEEQMKLIISLTQKGCTRPEIARKVGVFTSTIWRYQKKFNLL